MHEKEKNHMKKKQGSSMNMPPGAGTVAGISGKIPIIRVVGDKIPNT